MWGKDWFKCAPKKDVKCIAKAKEREIERPKTKQTDGQKE